MESSSLTSTSLSARELECLAAFARDEQDYEADDIILARLEHLGLLMRGWGRTFVVTQQGLALCKASREHAQR